jgi:N-acetylglucosaminyl-diphospho-decaprenol L-rhamnosyltransferase
VPVSELSIVVVSYNTSQYLETCLRSVVDRGYELIVVDNGSPDGSAELVRESFPQAALLALSENLGFGAGANRGIEASSGRFVLVLNPDAWPRDEASIPTLLAYAEARADVGVVGPRLVDLQGREQISLVGLPTRWWTGARAISARRPGRLDRALLRRPRPRGAFVVGAALLLRREALEQVGGFDPDFFMFGEEVDLCRRMQRAGWRIDVCAEATFVHVGGAATRSEGAAMYREQVRSHLRAIVKGDGIGRAQRAARFLQVALRVRGAVAPADRPLYRETISWLRSAPLEALLAAPRRSASDRTAGSEDRTSRSAG